MTVGIYVGTFDPPHLGHLRAAMTFASMVKFLFIVPSGYRPEKPNATDPKLRYEMCREAFKYVPHSEVLSYEAEKEGETWTADTIWYIDSIFADIGMGPDLYLCVGSDLLWDIPNWKSQGTFREGINGILSVKKGELNSSWIRENFWDCLETSDIADSMKPGVVEIIKEYKLYARQEAQPTSQSAQA